MATGAPLGNQNGVVLKDPEMRQRAFNQLCQHLAKGKSLRSWYFEEGDHMCCYSTMMSYIEKNPLEFASIKKTISEIKGYQYWESVCEDSATGVNPDANTASLQMVMRNKYKWDAKEDKSDKEPDNADMVDKDNRIMELEAKLSALQSKIDNQS